MRNIGNGLTCGIFWTRNFQTLKITRSAKAQFTLVGFLTCYQAICSKKSYYLILDTTFFDLCTYKNHQKAFRKKNKEGPKITNLPFFSNFRYSELIGMVDQMFPPMTPGRSIDSSESEFTSFSYWRAPLIPLDGVDELENQP